MDPLSSASWSFRGSGISYFASLLALPWLADLYVDASGNCGTADGTMNSPYCTISEAINAASAGDTVHVAPGTYFENVVIPFDLELVGTEGRVRTMINGGAVGSVVHVQSGAAATIEGFTLENGIALQGGGVLADGDLVLRNSTVARNSILVKPVITCGVDGAGIASGCEGSNILIQGCTVEDNIAPSTLDSVLYAITSRGGGVSVRSSTLTIEDSTISRNFAGVAGGINAVLSVVTLRNTTISENSCFLGPSECRLVSTVEGSLMEHVTIGYGTSFLFPSGFEHLVVDGSSAAEVQNCLFESRAIGGITSLGGNFVARGGDGFVNGVLGDQVGSEVAPLDALLGPLTFNGTENRTMVPRAQSPVIDAAPFLASSSVDQLGEPRPAGPFADCGAVEVQEDTASLCNGDGGDQLGCTDCPCLNEAVPGTLGGCLNSTGAAARLRVSGSSSLSLPQSSNADLRVSLTGVPSGVLCVLLSGDQIAPTGVANPCFGQSSGTQSATYDGLRCAVQGIRRHGARGANVAGEVGTDVSPWGGEGSPHQGIVIAGGGFALGQTRYFQVVYRDDPLAGCMRGLNTSQAAEVTMTP